MATSLCRMISYNIGQLAYLNAKRYNLPNIYFGGFFIRGHPYTMDTISFAIQFWSKGEMSAKFLRHEGFLGAVGAFLKVPLLQRFEDATQAQARFVERFTVGAPVFGGEVRGPAMSTLSDKVSWVEKFIAVAQGVTERAKSEHEHALQAEPELFGPGGGLPPRPASQESLRGAASGASEAPEAAALSQPRISLNVGVLQYTPTSRPFPLLDPRLRYEPSTIDINVDRDEMDYWIRVLEDGIPTVVEKAAASEGHTRDAVRRAASFGRVLRMHLVRLRAEPGAYGQLSLADLFELREECLREFGFDDVYRLDKERENSAALDVLPDLLDELDGLDAQTRLTALIQGALAANIFDWGAQACVEMYQNATILEMYRRARTKLSQRPWRVDDLDAFAEQVFGRARPAFRRVLMFVDNAGADVVLGMLPLAREFLRLGAEVVLIANSLPAINDVTAAELRGVVARAAEYCPIRRAARDAAVSTLAACGGHIPPADGAAPDTGLSNDLPVARGASGHASASAAVLRAPQPARRLLPHADELQDIGFAESHISGVLNEGVGDDAKASDAEDATSTTQPAAEHAPASEPFTPRGRMKKGMFGESYPPRWKDPR